MGFVQVFLTFLLQLPSPDIVDTLTMQNYSEKTIWNPFCKRDFLGQLTKVLLAEALLAWMPLVRRKRERDTEEILLGAQLFLNWMVFTITGGPRIVDEQQLKFSCTQLNLIAKICFVVANNVSSRARCRVFSQVTSAVWSSIAEWAMQTINNDRIKKHGSPFPVTIYIF